ncbi:MAG: hypothetical protein JWP17_683 [Solirubrobacterales bacterium]|nr:hypothetical protein [Solirubrobacterales bacterium]
MRHRGALIAVLLAALPAAVTGAAAASAHDIVPATWTTGANVTDWSTDGYRQARDVLEAARADGITSVSLVPTVYMDGPTDSSVERDLALTPSDESLRQAAMEARSMGLSVTIKPHVDVLDESYRGDIQPADRAAWFASYQRLLVGYATLAREVGAETLVVGTELDSVAGDHPAWTSIIAAARSAFPGELTYAANWSAVTAVPFWNQLDVIGVDAYVPLGDAGSTPAQLRAAWTPLLSQLTALHDQTGMPVTFTELGYQSRSDGLRTPFAATGPSDEGVQARGYDAAFAVWSGVPWFRGISWWDFPVRPGEPSAHDGEFSPRGKTAEDVLRSWTGGPGSPASTGSASDRGGGGLAVGTLLIVLAVAGFALAISVAAVRRRLPSRDEPGDRRFGVPVVQGMLVDPVRVANLVCAAGAEALVEQARSTLDSVSAVLFLRDPNDALIAHVAVGVGVSPEIVGRSLSSSSGLMGHVLETGNPIAVADYSKLPDPIRHHASSETSAALSVPVRLDGRVIGALTVARNERYAPSERHLLSPLADELAALLPPWIISASWPADVELVIAMG